MSLGITFARPSRSGYGRAARTIHWTAAALLGLSVASAWSPWPSGGPARDLVIGLHQNIGLLALALLAARAVARAIDPPPPLPAALPAWQRAAASASHLALYALLLAVPLLGWAQAVTHGHGVSLLGIVPLPQWLPVDHELGTAIQTWHRRLAKLLLLAVGVHVAAAAWHGLVRRDGIVERMLPTGR
ncbi:MAG TPA: cytochrome b/b6 domain-containing protein [Alphaproteobacteria bacterium]|nr:cytochrome b/b6 domain-containing protein [Alphaproteobacteria bacterium]